MNKKCNPKKVHQKKGGEVCLVLSCSLFFPSHLSHAPLYTFSFVSAHQLAEDYVNVVHNIMYDYQHINKQPHQIMARSRPATILEQWNPREVALFEAAMYLHGKQFHKVQRLVKTKSTKDIVAFYYIWKKTSHYTEWKLQYTSDDESDCEHEGAS